MIGALRRLLNRLVVPRSLFGRAILIVVIPVVVLQVVLTYIFYNRHWDNVTRLLASGVAGEVATLVDMIDAAPTSAAKAAIIDLFREHTALRISLEPDAHLAEAVARAGIADASLGHIDGKILQGFQDNLPYPFALDLRSDRPKRVVVYVETADGVLRVLAPRGRVTSTTTGILLIWMVGSSLVLLALAIYTLRRQVRPIRRLAKAMDAFGKGRDFGDLRPAGASEIRLAASAFNAMRARILRHVTQRTELLAAISHDLRTPLTRMKLELEMMEAPETGTIDELRNDVSEMQELVEAYLTFAKGEGQEPVEATDLQGLLEGAKERAERGGLQVELACDGPLKLPLRPLAFRRCLGNLVDNACRYANWLRITMVRRPGTVEIALEDDGPGIAPDQREAVFQPFVRLEASRSRGTGGLGLGLTIARDIVRAHGGELTLGASSRGGLRALVMLPE